MRFTLPARSKVMLMGFATLLATANWPVTAQSLTPDEQAFFDKHTSDIVHLEPMRVGDAAFVRVFAMPVYRVKVVIQMGDGTSSQDMVLARSGEKLVCVSRPGSDADMPDFPKMLTPSFKLRTDDDAKGMQSAMDVIYPLITDDEKKAVAIQHTGNRWTFIRGKFFDHHMGFILETDADGTIKSAKYSLQLP